MVDIVETEEFEPVPLIETGEKVKGGDETAPANKQAVALVKRTAFLKAQLTALAAAGLKVVGTLADEAALDAIDTTDLASSTAYFVSGQLYVWNTTEWVSSGSLLGPRGVTILGTWPNGTDLPDVSLNEVGDAYIWKSDIWLLAPSAVPVDGQPTPPNTWGSLGLVGPEGASAYQAWLNAGNTGNEATFVATLVGKSAYQIWEGLGNTGTEADFIASLKSTTEGPIGPEGPAKAAFVVKGVKADVASLPTPGKVDEAWYVGSHLYVWVEDADTPANNAYVDIGEAGGLSAYELWVAQGNTGTVQQFLDSLKSTVPGPIGPQGNNLNVLGTVAKAENLPSGQNVEIQDAWVTADDGHLHVYRDTGWVDIGPFVGSSAYQVWEAAGNTGDVNAFLASLKGTNGVDGTNLILSGVVTAFTDLPAAPVSPNNIYAVSNDNIVYAYIGGNWKSMGQFRGAAGQDGTDGKNGTSINIIKILTEADSAVPDATTNAGNAYIDLNNRIQLSNGTDWIDAGPVGAKGDTGPMGTGLKIKGTVYSTTQLPKAEDSDLNDAYFTSIDKMMYVFEADGWVGPIDITGLQGIQGIQGIQGKDGASINILGAYDTLALLTAAHPTGNLGDGYLVGNNLAIWSTANGGGWIDIGLVRGPQGIQGVQGIQGIQGKQGLKGDKGASWITLPVGQDAPSAGFTGNVGDWAVSSTFKVYYKTANNGWQYWGQLVAGDVNSPQLSVGKVVRLGNDWVPLLVDEVPNMVDGKLYVRHLVSGSTNNSGEWTELVFPAGIAEPTNDGKSYMRMRVNGQDVGSWAVYTAPTLASLGGVALTELGISVAQLVNGTVPASQLPSYVDDVLEVDTKNNLPTTGEKGKIYITDDTNVQYRWSGTAYVALVASPGTSDAVVEGSTNLYYTPARVRGVPLTGIDFTAKTAITATDTVLTAFGKLQAQMTAFVPGFADTPTDTNLYLRKGDHTWVVYTAPAAGISDAPTDTNMYVRMANAWARFNRYDLNMVAATTELDLSVANVFKIANSSARTLTFKAGTVPGATRSMTVVLIIDGAGVITWPTTIVWSGSAQPTLGATTTVVTLLWDGIGNRWIGTTGATI